MLKEVYAMNRRIVLSVFVAGALAFAMAKCDFNPTAPFAGFDGEQGATLNGQFQQSGTATAQRTVGSSYMAQSALGSASDDVVVTEVIVEDVNGNEIGRVDVNDGAFTLRGLPESFTLVFLDGEENELGEMEFDGVKPNQEIDIVVALVDDEVVLIEEKRTGIDHEGSSGIEIEGVARDIDIDSHPMTGSLDVNDGVNEYHVLTRAGETSIRKGNRSLTLEDLIDGDQVHVRGVFEGDDVFAFEIKLQEEEEEENTSAPACTVIDPAKPNHILICHKGKTKSVSPDAWPGHYGHGDKCGPC
jgi:hypothetical protein